MARKSKMTVLKRQREMKKAEKAALKRSNRDERRAADPVGQEDRIASRDDLEGYGFGPDEEDEEAEDSETQS
jgi:hypothetical protein